MHTIAILGLGHRIAGVTACLLAAAPGRIRLAGWSDPTPAGLDDLHRQGIATGTGYDDPARMITELKPDTVLVGSPNHLHLAHIRLALEAGCTVFSEKPVVTTPEETWELGRLLARHGEHRLHVGLVLRSSPLFRTVHRLVRDGRLGTLVSFEANEHLHPEHGGFIMRDWRRYRRYAGSYLLEKCCHDFDLYNALVGRRARRVASFGGHDVFRPAHAALADGPSEHSGAVRYQAWRTGWQGTDRVFDTDADTLDNQVALVEYEGGARLAFHSNAHNPIVQRRWLIAGTLGAVCSDLHTSRVTWHPAHGQAEEIGPDQAAGGAGAGHYGADQEMGRDLAATLLDGAAFPVPAKASLEAGLVCMAVDLAQRDGRIVDLAPWWEALDRSLAPAATAARA